MNEKIFQDVFDMVQEVLPNGWKKFVLFVGYTAGSYSIKYYTDDGSGVYTDCFSQKNVNKLQLMKLFMNIDKILASERKKLDDKNKWSVMTMIVNFDGSMKVELDYTDISENTIAYEQEWKNKYL